MDNVALSVGDHAQNGEDGIPNDGTESGENGECAKLHSRKACRNRDQLANGRNQSADECRNGSVVAEELFGLFHFLGIQQAHVPEPGVGKLVNDRLAENLGEEVVDESSAKRPERSGKNEQNDVQARIRLEGLVGCRRNNDFAWERNKRAFDCH